MSASRRQRPAAHSLGATLFRSRPFTLVVFLVVAISAGVVLLLGCGPSVQQKASTAGGSVAPSGVGGRGTPQEIGAAVSAAYEEAMIEVTGLLDLRGSAASLRPKVEQLKEKYVARLVTLGKRREALAREGRAVVDAAIAKGLQELPADLCAAFGEGQAYYHSQDLELGNLIASFNIITRYANFDLLRSQEPEEVERLGL